MNKQKLSYEAPSTDLFVVRFETGILQASVNSVNHTEYFGADEDGGELS